MPSFNTPFSEAAATSYSHDDSAVSGVQFVSGAAAPTTALSTEAPLPTLDDAMRTHIGLALVRARGRIEGKGGAADLLGVNPHTLRGKMRRLKIEWARFRTA